MLGWILSSCVLIVAVLLLRAVLGGKISAELRYALWAVVLVRLLVPVQLTNAPVPEISGPELAKNLRESISMSMPVQSEPVSAPTADRADVQEESGGPAYSFERREMEGIAEAARRTNTVNVMDVLKALWAAGGAALALALLVCNMSFAARLRRVRRPLVGAGCTVPVYVAEGLPSPCLFGVREPAVYVTADMTANPVMLRHVLAHETTHYRHRDHIWSILRGVALAVHWWNPLVWLAVVLSRRDGELACDEDALKRLGREERHAYGETLLALVTAKPGPKDLLCCATTMSGEKRSLRERIRRIACEPKQLVSAVVAVAVVIIPVTLSAFGREPGGTDIFHVAPGYEVPMTDLNRDGIPESIEIFGVEVDGTWKNRLEFNQEEDSGAVSCVWSVTMDETHGGCGTYFLYQENGADYLLEYMPKMQQGQCTYFYRLFHVEDGEEVVDRENSVEFDINFASPSHVFDPAEIAAFMKEVNDLIGKSKLLTNTNHWMLNLEEDADGKLYDNILVSLNPSHDVPMYQRDSLEESLTEYAAYFTDHPDDIDSPLGDFLAEVEESDFGSISGQSADTARVLASLLRDAASERTSRFYDNSTFEEQEIWVWTEAEWDVPLTEGRILHLFTEVQSNYGVYIVLETADGAPAASFSSRGLYEMISRNGEAYPAEILPYTPDLNHDGKPDELRILAGPDGMSWSLQCVGENETGPWRWFDNAYSSHAGWNALFLCRIDGEDYLLRYNPYMCQGGASYRYKLFYLQYGAEDREVAVQENEVSFDIHFTENYAAQHVFEPKEIAAFMDEVNALLAGSVQLLNTDQDLLDTFSKAGLRDRLGWMDHYYVDLTMLANLLRYRNRAIREAAVSDVWGELTDLMADNVSMAENITDMQWGSPVEKKDAASALSRAMEDIEWNSEDWDEETDPRYQARIDHTLRRDGSWHTIFLEAGETEGLVRISCTGAVVTNIFSENAADSDGHYLTDVPYNVTVYTKDAELYQMLRDNGLPAEADIGRE